MDSRVLIYRLHFYNTFPRRGQRLSGDKWFARYWIFRFGRIFDDVIDKSADVSKNNDIIVNVLMENKSTNVTL